MNRKYLFSFLALLLVLPIVTNAQQAQYPIIKEYGGIYKVPGAVNPDMDINYKIVVDLKTNQPDKDKINRGLNNVARMMNLHGLGGVPAEKMQVAVAVHGNATDVILNNRTYSDKYGMDNPNMPLIEALNEAGVELYVCGQSLLGRGYEHGQVHEEVTIGLSMLTVVTEHMHEGYKLLVFE
jgi:intracellular sulfur oxidation DsrE/DsrF family protein